MKGFYSPNATQSREKNCKDGRFFDIADRPEKLYGWSRLYTSAQGRHETGGVLLLFFFESFLWHFKEKQRAEVIFTLPRPVWCKNQENGSGKQWSLHAVSKNVGCRLSVSASQPTQLEKSRKLVKAELFRDEKVLSESGLSIWAQTLIKYIAGLQRSTQSLLHGSSKATVFFLPFEMRRVIK